MDFKIGDIIKPKDGRTQRYFKSLVGTVVDFLGTREAQFPIIKNQDGDLLTVNPDNYERTEAK